MSRATLRNAAAALGRKGGAAGRGASKRRSRAHYAAISGRAIRWEWRGHGPRTVIRAGRLGWLVEIASARVHVPYSEAIPRTTDLEVTGAGDLVREMARCALEGSKIPGVRVVAKSRTVR